MSEESFVNVGPERNHLGPTFSINRYDEEGDACEWGIFLHFGPTCLKVARNLDGFKALIKHMESIAEEIAENY